jgi:hypothetical protein
LSIAVKTVLLDLQKFRHKGAFSSEKYHPMIWSHFFTKNQPKINLKRLKGLKRDILEKKNLVDCQHEIFLVHKNMLQIFISLRTQTIST